MRQLLNLLADNRGRGQGLRAEATDEAVALYVYDAIGIWGVEAAPFVAAVRAVTAPRIDLHLNSPGGDVFDARAMKVALEAFSGQVVVHVDGVAASAASFLAMAADEVVMADGAFLMIHNAWGITVGNAVEHRAQAELLDKVDESLVADYVAKSGKDADEVRRWMAAETWFTADEAIEAGLADRKVERKAAKASYRLDAYGNLPAALAARPEFDVERALTERDRYAARLRLYELA